MVIAVDRILCGRKGPASIHLLGIQYNPIELERIELLGDGRVLGVDTSLPWTLAQLGVSIPATGLIYKPEGHVSEEEVFEADEGLVRHGARSLLRMASARGDTDD
jgi:hypothetical protein